jgi:hypothetical protein
VVTGASSGIGRELALALAARGMNLVLCARRARLLQSLTERIERLDNIDPERVTSLATENNIVVTDDGLIVESFFEIDSEAFGAPPGTPERARQIRDAVADFPLLQGSLVARDGSAAIIVTELLDDTIANSFLMSIGSVGYFDYGQNADNPVGLVAVLGWEPNAAKALVPYITLRNDVIFHSERATVNSVSAGVRPKI